MKYICPLVVVEDIKRSRILYEKILGQTVKMDLGENITFNGDFAIHQKDHYQKLIGNNVITKGSNNFELYFEDDDLESIVLKRPVSIPSSTVDDMRERILFPERSICVFKFSGKITSDEERK